MGFERQQFLAENISIEICGSLVKAEIDGGGRLLELIVPFDVFVRAERRSRAVAAEIAERARAKVAKTCRVYKFPPR